MAKRRAVGRSVAIDTVPLPEDVLGMPVKKGTVSKRGERYYLAVGRRRVEIPVGLTASRAEVAQFVGKEVWAAFSKTNGAEIVAIGTWPTPELPTIRRRWIVCYIPAPEMMGKVRDAVRQAAISRMVGQGILTRRMAREIRSGMRSAM